MHLQSAQSISDSSCPIKTRPRQFECGRRCGFLGRPPWISRGSLGATARQRKSLGVPALDLPETRGIAVCVFLLGLPPDFPGFTVRVT